MNQVAKLRLGTRGSALALWQANRVAELLRAADPDVSVEIVIIRTTGDARQDVPLPVLAGKGVFVREIESALLRGDIELAVHSAKDLQSTDPEGLTLAAFCERADPRDALISPRYKTLESLPPGATVATGAPRRVAQLRAIRPDLQFTEIRGNVDTRLEKLARGDADAIVLAVAGLTRLGRQDAITQTLSVEQCLPQVGQACVAVQCRAADTTIIARIAACNHAPTHIAVTAERAFLASVGGGCTAPVAAHAVVTASGELELTARVAAPTGTPLLEARGVRVPGEVSALVSQVYHDLIAQGAATILEE